MTIRFFLCLIFLALILAGNYLLTEQRIAAMGYVSDVMDNMGRQQMIAQRVALLSRSLIDSNYDSARKHFRKEILNLAKQMEEANEDLVRGSLSLNLPKPALEKVQRVYTEEPTFLDRDIKRFITSVKTMAESDPQNLVAVNPHYLYVLSLAQSNQLVGALNQIVKIYQEESASVVQRSIFLGRLQLGLILIVLAGMGAFVFRPMARRIRKEIDSLSQINERLDQQATEVAQANKKLKDKEGALVEIMEDLAVQKKSLQNEVTERTKAQERLKHLMEKLGRVNKELNDFAYVVSHDLKAPIRGIGSLATWMLNDNKDKLGGELKESLELITGRVKRMNELIDGLLKLAKVGRTEGETQSIDLNLLVRDIVDFINPPKNISIKIDKNLATVYYDRTRIQQVFQNLLSNAVKYMDKPTGEISIKQKTVEDTWQFAISDNGPGIEKKHHDRIFKIFQTISPKDTAESTGIGLSLVQKIIEAYGGKVWVQSEVGKGSTFYFTLPKTEVGSMAHAA